jgi:flagellar biosynthesis anti-sigma factor FlgM
MRVDLNNLLARESSSVQSAARGNQSAANNNAGNSTAVTSEQLSAASLSRTVTALPEVRQEKVAALAQQLRNGEYRVTAQQTADAMVSQMRERQAA